MRNDCVFVTHKSFIFHTFYAFNLQGHTYHTKQQKLEQSIQNKYKNNKAGVINDPLCDFCLILKF